MYYCTVLRSLACVFVPLKDVDWRSSKGLGRAGLELLGQVEAHLLHLYVTCSRDLIRSGQAWVMPWSSLGQVTSVREGPNS